MMQWSLNTFLHGIHPGDYKHLTRHRPIERMPFVAEYFLPLSQHLGSPSRPLVKPGETVYRGKKIAAADGFVSIALHAPVTGYVKDITLRHHPSGKLAETIIIECDPASPQSLHNPHLINWQELSSAELLSLIQENGFAGLGGAAFPTHVKLTVPEGKKARFLVVNGVECEPYLTSDHRLMLERYTDIFTGIRIAQKILGVEKTYLGIEDNKADAIAVLAEHLPADIDCTIVPLVTKYPQGAEKMLIKAVLHRELPGGKLPIDLEVVVNNVGTIAGLGQWVTIGQPLIERIVTVSGPGVQRPSNLLIPIGTPLSEILAYCGLKETTSQILFGGPMMGVPQAFLDVPILKGTSGILCLEEESRQSLEEYPCIRCLRCVDACPVYLNPSRLGVLAKMRRYDEMMDYHILNCMECGSCTYVCPSNIPLVQRFRVAKTLIREKQARKRAAV